MLKLLFTLTILSAFFAIEITYASDCRTHINHFRQRFLELQQQADTTLEQYDQSQYLLHDEPTHLKNLLSIQDHLETDLLMFYEQSEKQLRKGQRHVDNPDRYWPVAGKLDDMFSNIELALDFNQQLLDFLKLLKKDKIAVETRYRELRQSARKKSGGKLPAICDLFKENIALHYEHLYQQFEALSREWLDYYRSEERLSSGGMAQFFDRLNSILRAHVNTRERMDERIVDLLARQNGELYPAADIKVHPHYTKEESSIPHDVKIKASDFILDLARNPDRRSLIEAGYNGVTSFKLARGKGGIPGHIQFWHYHLKRGIHDHVIIWALNKHDKRQRYYLMWIGHHGQAPYYQGEKSFSHWVKGKLPFLDPKK